MIFYPGLISGNDGKVLGDVYLIKPSNFEVLDEFGRRIYSYEVKNID
jgi:gamma-glutamylcyclotransferase (GGCT)/AIG2-like uncharacterized protein YtfP